MAQAQKESKEEHKEAMEKVQKPNRDAYEKELAELDRKIKENKAVVDEVNAQFEKMKAEKEKAGERKQTPEETKLNELRAVSKGLSDTRKALLDELNKSKDARKSLHEKYEAMRKRIRDMSVSSLDHLEKKIRELEFTMSTTSMSLREERGIMQDIKNLTANKKLFSEVDAAKQARDNAEAKQKEIKEKLDENKAQLDKAKAEEDAAYKVVSKQRDSRKGKRVDVPAMIERRNKAREQLKELHGKITKLRTDFRAKEDAWRKVENERWREKKEKAKADYEAREEERRMRRLEKEEETFETLHADKLASVDQLITYLRGKQGAAVANGDAAAEETPAAAAEEEENLIGKNVTRLDDDVFGTKVQKKGKGKKKGGKKKQPSASAMAHDLNCLQEFSTLKVSAPVSAAEIPACIEALEKKREELKEDKKVQWAKYQVKKEKALAEAASKKEDGAKDSDEKKGESADADAAAPAAAESTEKAAEAVTAAE